MSNHRPGGDLRDWLTARIDGQLDEAPPDSTSPPTPHATRRPAPRKEPVRRPLHQGRFDDEAPTTLARGVPTRPDDDDAPDPETVQGSDFSLEDSADPHTVRIHRMPVAFIGESVIDPETVQLDNEEMAQWRAQAPVDEIPMFQRGTPTPHPRSPQEILVRATQVEPRQDWVGLFATALLGGGLGLIVVGIWAWMIR